jgi:MFS family permease
LLPWLVAVAFFMESLDTTILNTAVPVVSEALGVAPLSMKSVLASHTLSLAVFIPISGWMADRFGARYASRHSLEAKMHFEKPEKLVRAAAQAKRLMDEFGQLGAVANS